MILDALPKGLAAKLVPDSRLRSLYLYWSDLGEGGFGTPLYFIHEYPGFINTAHLAFAITAAATLITATGILGLDFFELTMSDKGKPYEGFQKNQC